ncbi:MAG: hypothetical protein ACI4PY_04020 [Akkermansia muciniphila]
MDAYQSLRKNIHLWILTFAILLQVALIVCRLLGTASYGDWDIFQYIGWACSHGQSMYVDCWDNKGPLVFLFNAIGMFGGEWSGILFFGLSNCLFTLCLHGAFSQRYGRWRAAAAALIGSIALTYVDGGNTGNTAETVAVVLTGVGLLLFYRFDLGNSGCTAFWQGCLAASLFFAKATYVGLGFFYICTLFFFRDKLSGLPMRALSRFALGGLCVVLAVLLAFGTSEHLAAMYDGSIYYNVFEYHSNSSFWKNAGMNIYVTWPTLTIPALFLIILVMVNIFRGGKNKLSVALILWFLFEMLISAKVDTFFLHYLAIAAVVVIPMFLEFEHQSYLSPRTAGAFGVVISFIALYWLSFISRVQIHNLISTASLRLPAQYACEKGLKGKRAAMFGMAGVCRVARLSEMRAANTYVVGVGHYIQTDSASRRRVIVQDAIQALNCRSTDCLVSEGSLGHLPWADLPEWKKAADGWEEMASVEGIWFYRRK